MSTFAEQLRAAIAANAKFIPEHQTWPEPLHAAARAMNLGTSYRITNVDYFPQSGELPGWVTFVVLYERRGEWYPTDLRLPDDVLAATDPEKATAVELARQAWQNLKENTRNCEERLRSARSRERDAEEAHNRLLSAYKGTTQ